MAEGVAGQLVALFEQRINILAAELFPEFVRGIHQPAAA